ncbi:MAG TPA: serine hydrolase domain-containing protein [Candidatus Binatia bacterium]|nr:serine hydrolase domain-containing protein [Candidatus Binatia bacterium]
MTTARLLCAALALGLSGAPTCANPDVKATVDAVAARLLAAGEAVGLVIGVEADGKEQVFAYGTVAAGSATRPSAATVFQIGSVTKPFTATLLAALARRGVVRLDDPLARWVPIGVVVPKAAGGRPITLLDLATHTAGLPRTLPHPGTSLASEQMFRLFPGLHPQKPGEVFVYSDLGYALLAHALMRATGAAYEPLLRREVCDPLGLADTRVAVTPAEAGRRATGYGAPGFPAPAALDTWPAFAGANGLSSTAHDLLAWVAFNLGLRPGPLAPLLDVVQERRHDAESSARGVALGWQLAPLGGDLTAAWASGATPGFFAYVGFVRATGTGVVLLSNTRAPKGRAGVEILRALNGAVLPAGSAAPAEEPAGDVEE